MNRSIWFAFVGLTVLMSSIAKGSPLCDMYMNNVVGLDDTALIKDGALVVDTKSPLYVGMDGTEKSKTAKIKMQYFPGEATVPYIMTTNVRFEKTANETTISRRADSTAKLHPLDVIGFEAKFDTNKSGSCEVIQNVAIFRDASRAEFKRLVFDKKYCDQVRKILGAHGDEKAAKEKLKTCTDFLGDVQQAFNLRKAELKKDGIAMSDSISPMAVTASTNTDEQNAAGLVLSLMGICTPHDWTQFGVEMHAQVQRGSSPTTTRETAK